MTGRDNGFVARHYLPLADLDPRLAEAMLDVLRAESIAAYVEPSTGHVGGYLEVHLPERPRDRLWVDRERRDRAASLLSEHTAAPLLPMDDAIAANQSAATHSAGEPGGSTGPASDASGIDDAWAQLVANYDLPSADAVPRWPVAEDVPSALWPSSDLDVGGSSDQQALPLDGLAAAPDASSAVPRRIVRPADRDPSPRDVGVGPADPMMTDSGFAGGEYDPLSILDEHFVPPPPPPVPALRPVTKWAIVSIVAGFALILVKAFTDAVPGSIALGVIGIVGGFGTLVAGMRQDRSDDSDSDDGAVV
ncbi:MAG: hypothetical protein ACRDV3_12805 [Acidothermaceae bacterium]